MTKTIAIHRSKGVGDRVNTTINYADHQAFASGRRQTTNAVPNLWCTNPGKAALKRAITLGRPKYPRRIGIRIGIATDHRKCGCKHGQDRAVAADPAPPASQHHQQQHGQWQHCH